ncbi:MAG: hypothetical protein MHPSP_000666 [Paramarteilia canceri]
MAFAQERAQQAFDIHKKPDDTIAAENCVLAILPNIDGLVTINEIKQAADSFKKPFLTRDDFVVLFEKMSGKAIRGQAAKQKVSQFFDVLNSDGNGTVPFHEISSKMSTQGDRIPKPAIVTFFRPLLDRSGNFSIKNLENEEIAKLMD